MVLYGINTEKPPALPPCGRRGGPKRTAAWIVGCTAGCAHTLNWKTNWSTKAKPDWRTPRAERVVPFIWEYGLPPGLVGQQAKCIL